MRKNMGFMIIFPVLRSTNSGLCDQNQVSAKVNVQHRIKFVDKQRENDLAYDSK